MTAAYVKDSAIEGLTLAHRGKVRDVYRVDDEHLLLVTTDRISAFDRPVEPPLAGKGILLAEIAQFWFEWLAGTLKTHWVEGPADKFQHPLVAELLTPEIARRSMLVRRYERVNLECIVRGYMAGSAWRDYQRDGQVNGVTLPVGLTLGARFDAPIFTPSTKAEGGAHDEPLTRAEGYNLVGDELYERVERVSLMLYEKAHEYLAERGLILVDTKFEFGLNEASELVLIDEVFTPDSSRFWRAADWQAGKYEPFDKEFLRQWILESGKSAGNGAISLPIELQESTFKRYTELYKQVMEREFGG